jgi:hypothetical protein
MSGLILRLCTLYVFFLLGRCKPSLDKPGSSCKEPLGLQTGFLETRDIKTSSSLNNFTATDSWCSTHNDDKQFIAFDLGEDFSLSKVAIQGKVDDKNRYIEQFTMDYSSDAKKWSEYKDIFGKSDLDGNKNTYDVASHDLVPAIIARYVKLKPTKWNNGICATVDMFGCATDELKGGKSKEVEKRRRRRR